MGRCRWRDWIHRSCGTRSRMLKQSLVDGKQCKHDAHSLPFRWRAHALARDVGITNTSLSWPRFGC